MKAGLSGLLENEYIYITPVPISSKTAHIFQAVNEEGCVVTEIEIHSLTFPFLLI